MLTPPVQPIDCCDSLYNLVINSKNDDMVDDNNDNVLTTTSGATDDYLTNLMSLQPEKTPISTPNISLSLATLNVPALARPGIKGIILNESTPTIRILLSATQLPLNKIETINGITLIPRDEAIMFTVKVLVFCFRNRLKISTCINPLSERIITVCVKGSIANMSIIQVYAPGSFWSDQDAGDFYTQFRKNRRLDA